jgi:ribonuclease HI
MDANPNLIYGSIHIFSDSMYSLGCLTKGWQSTDNDRLIKAVKIRIRATPLVRPKTCHWHWTPGHAGVEGNTVADGLANEASAASKLGRGPSSEALSAAIDNGAFLQFANLMYR